MADEEFTWVNPSAASGADIARLFGISRSTVTREWVGNGCPSNDDDTFDLAKVIAWRIGVEQKIAEQRIGELKAAQIALYRERVKRERFNLAKDRRKYIAIAEAEQREARLALEFRTLLEGVPRTFAPRIDPDMPARGEEILRGMIDDLFRRLESTADTDDEGTSDNGAAPFPPLTTEPEPMAADLRSETETHGDGMGGTESFVEFSGDDLPWPLPDLSYTVFARDPE